MRGRASPHDAPGERGRSPYQELSELADGLVGQTRGLGNAVSRGARKSYANCIFQPALVTDGDKDRLDPASRPDDGPNSLVAIPQQAVRPPLAARLFVLADQPALGAADGRSSRNRPQMRSQSQPPRMRDPLPVNHEQVRHLLELRHSLQAHGSLAKGQQSGDIGKPRLLLGRDRLDLLELESFGCPA